MDNPSISVIIPVYNAEKTISKCVESVIHQTFKDFELILINDGSTDNTLPLLKNYEQQYANIIVVDKNNEGASLSRNRGIKIAHSPYIMFVDSDDFIDLDYLETFYKEISTNNLDMVIGGIRRVDNKGKIVDEIVLSDTEWSKYIITSPCTRIIRREFLEQEQLEFLNYTMEDIHFNAVFFSKSNRVKTIPYVGYNNFLNVESTTHTLHRGIRKEVDILHVLSQINNVVFPTEIVKFFYKKNYMYYLLFSGRYSSKETFVSEYHRIKQWIKENKLSSNLSPFNKQFKGERLKTKISMYVFEKIEQLHLIKLFAAVYCKGKE